MSDAADIVIRPLTQLAELRQVEALQREIWAMPERDVVPAHQLLAAAGAGGGVLGALAPSGELIGFCYGFVGLREGRPLFYSHMAGVRESYRGQEIGLRLKRAQRDEALARGLEHMVWTYDPLQSTNAHLNLHKLGARAGRYYVDYYGEMPDALNQGVPSDRLEVDWWLRDPAVERLMAAGAASRRTEGDVPAVLTAKDTAPFPFPGEPELSRTADLLRLEVPLMFAEIRRADLALAQRWRAATREAFLHYLSRGYIAVDFVRDPRPEVPGGAYILRAGGARTR